MREYRAVALELESAKVLMADCPFYHKTNKIYYLNNGDIHQYFCKHLYAIEYDKQRFIFSRKWNCSQLLEILLWIFVFVVLPLIAILILYLD